MLLSSSFFPDFAIGFLASLFSRPGIHTHIRLVAIRLLPVCTFQHTLPSSSIPRALRAFDCFTVFFRVTNANLCCPTQLYHRHLCFLRCQNVRFFLCSLVLVLIHVPSDRRQCGRVAFFFIFPRLHDKGLPASRFTARHLDPYPAFSNSTSSSLFAHFFSYSIISTLRRPLHDQLLFCSCCQNVRYFHFSDVPVLVNSFPDRPRCSHVAFFFAFPRLYNWVFLLHFSRPDIQTYVRLVAIRLLLPVRTFHQTLPSFFNSPRSSCF